MAWNELFINILLSLILLILNVVIGNWKKKCANLFAYSSFEFEDIASKNFSDNFFQLTIYPTIYLAIVCWILQLVSLDNLIYSLWLLIPLFWLYRLIIGFLRDMLCLINWTFQIAMFIVSIILSEATLYIIILPLLKSGKTIFIELEEFRDAFWFAAMCVIAKFIWDYYKYKITGESIYPETKKTAIIIKRHKNYYKKYNKLIEKTIDAECKFKSQNHRVHFTCVIYAIMILEAHNRPFWMRTTEYIIKLFCPKKKMSLGIMQYQTTKIISNKESIIRAIKKIYNAYSAESSQQGLVNAILDYNSCSKYLAEVDSIYEEITAHLGLTECD